MSPWNSLEPPEDGLPPKEVHFQELRVEPWPDGRKIRVHMQISPFLERPNVEVIITDHNHQEVASIFIVETIDDRMAFTMHIRGEKVAGEYQLTASLSYQEHGVVASQSLVFETEERPE